MINKLELRSLIHKCNKAIDNVSCTMNAGRFESAFDYAKEYCTNKKYMSENETDNLCKSFKTYYVERLKAKTINEDKVTFRKNDLITAFFDLAEKSDDKTCKVLASYEAVLVRMFFPELTPEEMNCRTQLLRFVAKNT